MLENRGRLKRSKSYEVGGKNQSLTIKKTRACTCTYTDKYDNDNDNEFIFRKCTC